MTDKQANVINTRVQIAVGIIGIVSIFVGPAITFVVTQATYGQRIAAVEEIAKETARDIKTDRQQINDKLTSIGNDVAEIKGQLKK